MWWAVADHVMDDSWSRDGQELVIWWTVADYLTRNSWWTVADHGILIELTMCEVTDNEDTGHVYYIVYEWRYVQYSPIEDLWQRIFKAVHEPRIQRFEFLIIDPKFIDTSRW